VAGDGYITIIEENGEYIIGLKCKDAELVMEFARCLEVVTCSKPSFRKRHSGFYIAEGYSKTLCELLVKPLDIEKLKQYIEYSEETITSFLRAFFDSEGYVVKDRRIYVYNTDLGLLNYVKELLLKLKIEVTGPHLVVKKGTSIYDRKRGKHTI